MVVARFYHLTRDPIEALLPLLIGKSLEIGLRVVLRGVDPARMEALDRQLWMGDGFLPHGMSGGAHDGDQPVLLTCDQGPAANGARCLIALDGSDVTPQEAQDWERLCIVFDGTNEAAVVQARSQWKTLTGADVAAEYWSRESGRWECRAKHPKAGA